MSKSTKPVKKVTLEGLKSVLMAHEIAGHTSAEFSYLETVTELKMNKNSRSEGADGKKWANPYYGKVQKVSKINVAVNVIYENAVNNKLVKNGEQPVFEAGSLPYGEWVVYPEGKRSKMLIQHNGSVQLRVMCNGVPQTALIHEGKEIEKSLLAEYLPPKRQSDIEDLGVIVRNFKMESITKIHLHGVIYEVVTK